MTSPSLTDLLVRQPMQRGHFAPVIGRDGRSAAFCTRRSNAGSGSTRYSATGVPTTAVGMSVHVVDLASGEIQTLGDRESTCWRPSFSPDGDSVAFFMATGDGPPQLWVHSLVSGSSRLAAHAELRPKLWAGDAPIWAEDGQSILVPVRPASLDLRVSTSATAASAEDRDLRVTIMRSRRRHSAAAAAHYRRDNWCTVARVDVSTGQTAGVLDESVDPPPAVFQVSPTGTWLSYLSVYRRNESGLVHDLVVVRLGEDMPRTVATGLKVPADQYFLHSYLWHPHRDRLFWIEDGTVRVLDLSDPDAAPDEVDLGEKKPVWPMSFTTDGALVVGVQAEGDEGGDTLAALAVVDPSSEGSIRNLAVPDELRHVGVVEARPGVVWQPDSTTAVAVIGRDREGGVAIAALTAGEDPQRVWQGPGRMTSIGADSQGRLVVLYEDLNVPPDLFRVDPMRNFLERLTAVEPALVDQPIGVTHVVHTEARIHGAAQTLRTSVITPAVERLAKRPTIVIGYPGARCSLDVGEYGAGTAGLPTAAFLLLGFRIVLVDLPLGPRRPTVSLADEIAELVDAQLDSASFGGPGLGPLVVLGHSYGAYGMAQLLTRSRRFAAGIGISGMYDVAGYGAHLDLQTGLTKWNYVVGGQGRMGVDPWEDPRRYLDDSPFYTADRISAPILLIHGDQDRTYPVVESTKLFSAIEHLGVSPVELAVYHGQAHALEEWSVHVQLDMINRITDFCERTVIV